MARKLVRYFIFFVCTLVVLFILVTLILPSTGRVVREAYIPVRKSVILEQLTNLQNYGAWFPWIQIDPSAKLSVVQNQRKVSWKGSNHKANQGSFEITAVRGDSAIDFRLNYNTTPSITGGYILRNSGDDPSTTVIWYMNMRAGWTPWWRFYAAMLGKLTGPVMEAGLTNLKMLSQRAAVYSNIPVTDTVVTRTNLAVIRDTVSQTALYTTLSNSFSKLHTFITASHLSVTGPPFAQFQVVNDSALYISTGIPVNRRFASSGEIRFEARPAGLALTADFQGTYKELQAVYKALSDIARRYPPKPAQIPWETYEDGVIPQNDSTNCHISVFYPVNKKS